MAFNPPPHVSAEAGRLNPLCPVRALTYYMQHISVARRTEQLFVCYDSAAGG